MVKFQGVEGEIKCAYQTAAKLGKWTLEHQVLEADPVTVSSFWMGQSPLTLCLQVGKRTWRWHNVELVENGHKIRVRVKGSPNK